MEILKVKTQNKDQLKHLIEMEKESNGMINGRQMIAARASVTVEFRANMIELLAIKKISNDIKVDLTPPKDDESYSEAFKMYTETDYSDIIKKENDKYLNLPIGVTEYNGICSFYGTNIRILTNTGNFAELFEKVDDYGSLEEKIPELFYRAVYKQIMSDLDFDYSVADTYFTRNLYSRLPENKRFTLMRVFLKDGISSVPFISASQEDVAFGLRKLSDELNANIASYGSYGLTAEISCYTSLWLFYILKVFGVSNIVIDEEPINIFIKKDHMYCKDTNWSKEFESIRKSEDPSQVLKILGLTPANTKIHYTINVSFSGNRHTEYKDIFGDFGHLIFLTENDEVEELRNMIEVILQTCRENTVVN